MHQKLLYSAVATFVSLAGLAAIVAAVTHTVLTESQPSLSSVQNDFVPSVPSATSPIRLSDSDASSVPVITPSSDSPSEVFSTLPIAAKSAQHAHNLAADGSTLSPDSN